MQKETGLRKKQGCGRNRVAQDNGLREKGRGRTTEKEAGLRKKNGQSDYHSYLRAQTWRGLPLGLSAGCLAGGVVSHP